MRGLEQGANRYRFAPFCILYLIMDSIQTHSQLRVYQLARVGAAMIFRLTLKFPASEKYEATNQIRRCARSVATGTAEAWRWRFYPAAFTSKIIEAEAEAAETQSWLDMVLDCGYITPDEHAELHQHYDRVLGQLVNTRMRAETWGAIGRTPSSAPRSTSQIHP